MQSYMYIFSCVYVYTENFTNVLMQTLYKYLAEEESRLENKFVGNSEKTKSRIIFLKLRENK